MNFLWTILSMISITSWNPPHEPVVGVTIDSVSVVIDHDQKFIAHTVLPKQTLYTIAKAYGVKVGDLYAANPELKERLVKMNEEIQVPLSGMEILPTITDGIKAYYYVQPKETIYRLSKVYFAMNPEHLMALNNLDQPELQVGQKLLIGTLKISDEAQDASIAEVKGEEVLFDEEFEGLEWVEEKSVAYWLQDGDESTSLFILHNEAPINSMVEITNPMYNRTVNAKVVGRIPPGAYTKDIDLILSHTLAEELGAIDPRFYVRVKYLY